MDSRAVGFARQWEIAVRLSRGRATVQRLAAEYGTTAKTIRRDLAILSRVFRLYRDRIGPCVYWSMAEAEGAQRVRVLLRRQRGWDATYPVIGSVA
jgi:hypothetical protein